MSEKKTERLSTRPRKNTTDPAAAAEKATESQNELIAHSLRPELTPQARHERIALLAYERAHARGFDPGGELEDWLSAEREVDVEFSGSRER
jgi:hypothetical protein